MSPLRSSSAEEFFTRRMSDAQVLLEAARRHLADGDRVAALAAALGGDVAVLQALVWERINVAPRSPMRQFFQAGEALTAVMEAFAGTEPGTTCGEVLLAARRRMAGALDDSLAADVFDRWPSLGYLAAVPAPTDEEVAASVSALLEGRPPAAFVAHRREQAAHAMLEAQSARVRGDSGRAIASAYDSDFLSLEAYLVESATAVGDHALLTVTIRWDLATAAVGALPGLPESFAEAVAAIREAVAGALGDADGERLAATLVAV